MLAKSGAGAGGDMQAEGHALSWVILFSGDPQYKPYM